MIPNFPMETTASIVTGDSIPMVSNRINDDDNNNNAKGFFLPRKCIITRQKIYAGNSIKPLTQKLMYMLPGINMSAFKVSP